MKRDDIATRLNLDNATRAVRDEHLGATLGFFASRLHRYLPPCKGALPSGEIGQHRFALRKM